MVYFEKLNLPKYKGMELKLTLYSPKHKIKKCLDQILICQFNPNPN